MKLKQFNIIALLAIICLFSCTKNSNCTRQKPIKGDKTVILKMNTPNRINTRASVELPQQDQSTVTLSTLDVYFYNDETGIIYLVDNLNAQDIILIRSSGLEFSSLHADVNSVAIIANNNQMKDLSVSISDPISTLFDKTVNVAYEQTFNSITLHGKNEGRFIGNGPIYTANVEIEPFVARIEVSDIACTNFGSNFSSLILKSVFVDQTHSMINLSATQPQSQSLFLADENDVNTAAIDGTDWWIYKYDNSVNTVINNIPFSPVINQDDATFVFHIIPSATIDTWVRLHLGAISNAVGAVESDKFVNVKSFKLSGTTNPIQFEAGMIYQLSIPFTEDNIVKFNDNRKDLTVNLTALPWIIEDGMVPLE